jgi:alpha-L-fucosidase
MKTDTQWFTEARFGLFLHWGLYALAGRHEWVQTNERISADAYERRYFGQFDPDLYDPKAWAKAAREAGMKYFVITTKHHEGFCLWDTQHSEFKAPNTPAGRDLIRPMVEAFREEGLRVGFYYSLLDWHHPEFPIDKHHPLRDDLAAREAEKNRDVSVYAEYLHQQVRELLTNFGKIDLLWFDFSYAGQDGKGRDDWQSEKLMKMVRELQPGVMVTNRLDLPGRPDFVTPEQVQPSGHPRFEGTPITWEGCQTFSGSWGYHRDEATWKSDRQCLWMLIDSVSKGGNLLMNVGPTARGEFDARAKSKLAAYGKWMRLHSRSIYGCTEAPEAFEAPADTRLTYNPKNNRLYIHLLNWPFGGLYLPEGYRGKIKYAQLLNDASELQIKPAHGLELAPGHSGGDSREIIALPTVQPDVEIPVIEVFL